MNRKTKYVLGGLVSMTLLLIATLSWAGIQAASVMGSWKMVGGSLGACIVLSFGVIGCAAGMGRIGFTALEGIARRPTLYNHIFTTMLISMALIEAICLYCLVVSFILIR
ncbi:MAG: ATP synthase F0 subunit C [bacterium]